MKPNIHMTSDDLMLAQVRRRLELNGYTGEEETIAFPVEILAWWLTFCVTFTVLLVVVAR